MSTTSTTAMTMNMNMTMTMTMNMAMNPERTMITPTACIRNMITGTLTTRNPGNRHIDMNKKPVFTLPIH